jgi:hypothetical protein
MKLCLPRRTNQTDFSLKGGFNRTTFIQISLRLTKDAGTVWLVWDAPMPPREGAKGGSNPTHDFASTRPPATPTPPRLQPRVCRACDRDLVDLIDLTALLSSPETMSALLLVDVQQDFIDGSLAVPNATDILPTVYDLLDNHTWDLVVASQVSP